MKIPKTTPFVVAEALGRQMHSFSFYHLGQSARKVNIFYHNIKALLTLKGHYVRNKISLSGVLIRERKLKKIVISLNSPLIKPFS